VGARGLEVQTTPLVGRSEDLAAIAARLDAGGLVTLTGTGGVGKTRLAVEVARRWERGAVHFVDLTEARDAGEICAAVADTLHVGLAEGRSAAEGVDRVTRALCAAGPCLVVLDNFEQVVGCAAETVARWRQGAPDARMLVTSRERLRVAGEEVREVQPLPVPAGEHDDSEAAQLFLQRARLARPAWEPEARDVRAVADIVRALEGLPLAIELCAARVGVLGPLDLLERLGDSLALLGGGARAGVTGRARTLRETIEWSWELLQPYEQSALAQCSVFRGGFSPDAAEEVLDGGVGAPSPLDVLQSLREKSLLRAWQPPSAPGRARLALWVPVAELAAEKLLAAEGGAAAAAAAYRHAEHYLRVGERWAAESYGPEGATRLAALALERDNLLAVTERGLEAGTAEGVARALRAVLALDPLFYTRGPAFQGLALLERVLGAGAAAAVPAELRARALAARGKMRRRCGRAAEGEADLHAAVELAVAHGDAAVQAEALRHLGQLQVAAGRFGEARDAAERSVAAAARSGDGRAEGLGRHLLGNVHREEGRLPEARREMEQALLLLRRAGDALHEGVVSSGLGIACLDEGRLEDARVLLERSLEAHRAARNRFAEGSALGNLGIVRQEMGDPEGALALELAAADAFRDVGVRRLEGVYRGWAGTALVELGRLDEALASLRQAEERLREAEDARYAAVFAAHRGGVLARCGRRDEARVLLDDAEGVLAGAGDPLLRAAARLQRHVLDPDPVEERALQALGARSVDVRASLRLLQLARAGEAPAALPRAGAAALVVPPGAEWFRLPGGETVSLQRRQVLRALLRRLAEQRLSAPGAATTVWELVEAAWPGQRALGEAGPPRVYTAVRALRRLGLADLLLSDGGGYLLDPAVPLARA
jgi:predicted ATPase